MKKVIYSLYVDVPAKEHYGNSKNKHDTREKASITVNAFKKHYDRGDLPIAVDFSGAKRKVSFFWYQLLIVFRLHGKYKS